MTTPIAIHPSIMVTRIAQHLGASQNTQLADIARLRMEMATAQAEAVSKEQPSQQTIKPPANGAEVDLLI